MIDPIMVHQQWLYESYYALASSVVQLNPKLKHILLRIGRRENLGIQKSLANEYKKEIL